MLKSETEILNKIVRGLDPAQITLTTLTAEYIRAQVPLIERECKKIQLAWADLLRSSLKDEVLKRFIPFQQRTLLELLDLVQGWVGIDSNLGLSPAIGQAYRECLLFLLSGLSELTDYLFNYFPTYFNTGSQLPLALLPKAIMQMAQTGRELSSALERSAIETELRNSIIAYLKDAADDDRCYPVTYHSLAFFNSLTNLLSFIIEHPNDRDISERICEAMLYINFNYTPFFRWYQNDTLAKLKLTENSEQKMLLLVDGLIYVKTIPVLKSSSYEPELPSVTVLIEHWLNEHIEKEQGKSEEQWQRLQLTVTVPQLGLLARLLYDEGFFAIVNISEILRFLSGCFSSKMQGHISAESMRKSFYGKDPFAAAAVKNLLLGMLEKVNRMISLAS